MDIKNGQIVMIPMAQLVPNEGQIEGVPANPRIIRDEQYNKLKASLQADDLTGVLPLKVYKHEGKYVVLGGNMRYRALQELGAQEVACIPIEDADAKTLRKIVQLDNATFGEWDYDMLANEWDADELKDWGVDLPEMEDIQEIEREGDGEPQPKEGRSELVIAGVSLFGQTGDTIVCEQLTPEQAERLLSIVKENGAQELVNRMLA